MKLLFENWRGYLEEEASKEQIKDVVTDVLKDEGGAAGLDPIKKEVEDLDLPAGFDLKAFLKGVQGVGQHEDGDYILGDDKQIHNQLILDPDIYFLNQNKNLFCIIFQNVLYIQFQ